MLKIEKDYFGYYIIWDKYDNTIYNRRNKEITEVSAYHKNSEFEEWYFDTLQEAENELEELRDKNKVRTQFSAFYPDFTISIERVK